MIEALMAHMALTPDAADLVRPLFIVHDGQGRTLLLAVDGAGRLLLHGGAWTVVSLPGPVRRADVRQAGDGTLCIALALADGSVLVACGIAPGLDDGWSRKLQPYGGLPSGARVTRLAFGPLQAGAPPLLLVSATVAGVTTTWYGNAATPAQGLHPLRLPAHACAVGNYRSPGAWLLRDGALRFTSFAAPGRQVDVFYPNLPDGAASVLLAPGSMPNVPDVFVAGAAIVVYRGTNTAPQRVADVTGARLVWSAQTPAGEYLVYLDGAGTLWLVSRPGRGAWRAPVFLAAGRVVPMALDDGTLHAASATGNVVTLLRFDALGAPLGRQTIPLPEMKTAPPPSEEGDGAGAARPDYS